MPERMRKITCEAFQKLAVDLIDSGADREDDQLESVAAELLNASRQRVPGRL